jgi:quercetin dioxygenase-like cupin family protein
LGDDTRTERAAFSSGGENTMFRKHLNIVLVSSLLVGAAAYIQSAAAQSGALSLEPLALGYSAERRVKIDSKGPVDVMTAKIVIGPLGDTGWHTHPGPAIVTLTKGTLTEYHGNGCISMYTAGSAFFEEAGEVHRVVNPGSEPAEALMTFLLPAGTPPTQALQPAPEPRPKVCGGRDHH